MGFSLLSEHSPMGLLVYRTTGSYRHHWGVPSDVHRSRVPYGGVLKLRIPRTMAFNTKMVHVWMIWGYPQLRKPAYVVILLCRYPIRIYTVCSYSSYIIP